MARINWNLLLAIYVVAVVVVRADDDDDDMDMSMSMSMSMDMSSASYSSGGTSLCNDAVSVYENNTITNGAHYSTCVNGTTYNITTLFDVENLTSSEFLTWCESETCLTPVHQLLDYMPQNCEVVYNGVKQNLYEEVSNIHAKCHAVEDSAKTSASASASGSKSSSTVGTTSGVSHATCAGLAASLMAIAVSYLLV